jgi:transcription initiation factor TFIIB
LERQGADIQAAVYAARREMGIQGTLTEIARKSKVKRKSVAKCYRRLLLELDLMIPMADLMKCLTTVANKANHAKSK